MNKLLIICGPTATGKTALAAELAKQFNGELVSADSRQVYKGMDIGTGKDTDKLQGIPMWMYDLVKPDEEFSVSHYQKLAGKVITDVISRGKLPIVVGGTGLYIQSLVQGLDTINIPPNNKLRKKLQTASVRELQDMLDPSVLERLNSSDKNNPRRLVRKIEIASFKGKITHNSLSRDILFVGLTAPLPMLYKRIDQRVDKRVSQGIIDEIKRLLAKGYTWDLPSMSGLGYREWNPITKNTEEIKHIIQKWKYDEHAYARRQLTWFKKQKGMHWFDVTDREASDKVAALVRAWYTTGAYVPED